MRATMGGCSKVPRLLLAREVSTRATRDVDLYRRTELVEAEIALREAVALDLGDWFTFEAGRS